MHRIDTEGSTGTWTNGNPALGQLGTEVDAAFMQDLQENVCHAIEQANIALAKGDAGQLYAAIIAIAAGAAGTGGGETPTTRKVSAGGLVTGGGDFTADRTLTVASASAADVLAGSRDDAAVTPAALSGLFGDDTDASGTIALPGGRLLKFGGYDGALASEGLYHIAFPQPFPHACLRATLTGINATASNSRDIWPQLVGKSAAGLDVFAQWTGNASTQQTLDGIDYWAVGY